MQVPIIKGIYTDNAPEFRASLPVNMVPVMAASGISSGFLRPADGVNTLATGPGVDRGGIVWDGIHYRVMGAKLVTVSPLGVVATLGDVGGTGLVSMDYSFDRLAIASSGNLYYWDGSTLTQVTDPDLGTVDDVAWVDGYFMTTDGTSLVVTELSDPTQVNPLKYGSSEADPDPVLAVKKVRNEPHAVNRYTIEVFDNTGGDLFPFSRIEGAQIQRGAVGKSAVCVMNDVLAFVGSGRNEPVSVYLGANARAEKIGTHEIDTLLGGLSDAELPAIQVEYRADRAHRFLYVHLPDRTLVYDAAVSAVLGEPIWHCLVSGVSGYSQYLARNFVLFNGVWHAGHKVTPSVGAMTTEAGEQWGSLTRWEFGTVMIYNAGTGGFVRELELVSLTGRVALGADPKISTSYTLDGMTWSQDKTVSAGKIGDRSKRIVWRNNGMLRHWRGQRFRGDSSAHLSFARLEAQLDPLAY